MDSTAQGKAKGDHKLNGFLQKKNREMEKAANEFAKLEKTEELTSELIQQRLERSTQAKLELVLVDSMVVTKIVKHVREQSPSPVNGQLFGLELSGVLEISHSFPVPDFSNSESEATQYQINMNSNLRDAKSDSNSVGWYQSAENGNFLEKPLLDVHASFQRDPGNSGVMLIFDSGLYAQGVLSLRAFRLTEAYLKLADGETLTTELLAKSPLHHNNVLEELPLRIRSSTMGRVLTLSLEQQQQQRQQAALEREQTSFDERVRMQRVGRMSKSGSGGAWIAGSAVLDDEDSAPSLASPLTLRGPQALERQLSRLTECIDEYLQDANSWMYWHRGASKERARKLAHVTRIRQDNALRASSNEELLPEETEAELARMFPINPEPARLDALLAIARLQQISAQTARSAGCAVTKLYTAKALQPQNADAE